MHDEGPVARMPEAVASEASVPGEESEFLSAILRAIPAFVLRVDAEERVSYINKLNPDRRLEEVIGAPIRMFCAPEDLEAFEAALEKALVQGQTGRYHARGRGSADDGAPAHYDGYVVPIEQEDGRRAACIVAFDVSERVAHARELEESQAKLRLALEATGLGLFVWTLQGDRVELDQRTIDLVGFAPTTPTEYVERAVHPADRARLAKELGAVRDGDPRFPDHRIVRPDGEVRWVLTRGAVVQDTDGRDAHLIGGILDITQRQEAEQHLRRVQKLDAIGNLTAGVAHNFNNMLTVIGPALELGLRAASDRNRAVFEDAQHALERSAELVKQLMTFAGRSRVAPIERCNLVALVDRAVSMCRNTFAELPIEFDSSSEAIELDCDSAGIEQVVVNLLINARDAMADVAPEQARIEVELAKVVTTRPDAPTGPAQSYARIRVLDCGSGISESVRQRLFEPFFTTKPPGKGTGLGLATSHAIVSSHGGYMVLEPRQPSGTVASIWLPVGPPNAG